MAEIRRKVLITGAAGKIGRYLTTYLGEQHSLILTDIRELEKQSDHPFFKCDVADLGAMREICQGIDTVVHLAANPNFQATWDELYQGNIAGAYSIFQAAHEAGCRRLIFAGSGHAVYGYPEEVQVHPDMPPRPLNLYGVSKVWGEALGRYYADQKGLSTICLRLGWVLDAENMQLGPKNKNLSIVLTYADMGQMFARCIDAPDELRFAIFNAVSDNRWKRLDISQAREVLGYAPQDDAYALAEQT